MPNSEEKLRLQAVVDTAVDGVIMIDGFGKIIMFNPACEKLFGYKTEEVMGQNVKMLMPEPFHANHDQYLANYQSTHVPKIIGIGREVSGRRKDGSVFPMDLSVGESKEAGGSMFVGIVHDLTDRKHTEAQLTQAQKMETVGQLSGGLAHDFNNLLMVIIGNAEVLVEKLKTRPDLKQVCDSIIGASERGAELTRRLLAFSRKQTLQPVTLDCNELAESMRKLLRRTLREDIEIKTILADNLVQAFADPTQLESAILNLSLNAQDAMPSGGSLTLTTSHEILDDNYNLHHPEVKAGEYVMISVTDDGEGMSPEVQEHAFEPFFTTKEVGKGSGLGLSMVYGFLKQSGGHVAIYSEPGLGTTVRLYIPVTAEKKTDTTEIVQNKIAMPKGSETILMVEDDVFVYKNTVASLESLGYKVVAAHNGNEALEHLQKGLKPDLLFSDVVMPGGISGWELIKRAQELIPELKVLLTSGYPLETLRGSNKPSMDVPLLNKPYRRAELANRLREVLEESADRRAAG